MMIVMTVRISAQTKRDLEAAALRDDRKPAALARLLVEDGLKKRGYLLTEHGDDRQRAGGQGVLQYGD
jgi:hypothetical protein